MAAAAPLGIRQILTSFRAARDLGRGGRMLLANSIGRWGLGRPQPGAQSPLLADGSQPFEGIATWLDGSLAATRQAFDSVAAAYDGPLGNNALVQRMRHRLWRTVTERLPPGARLLDLGCGTGIDAAHFAALGYRVLAVDLSPAMVERTRERAARRGVERAVAARLLGLHRLDELAGERFDGVYSDAGPLNCATDLPAVARACAALLPPGGPLIASVMGRVCPWEIGAYLLRGHPRRALVRLRRGPVPVGLNGHTVWTRYYAPRAFARAFAPAFALSEYRALGLALPPPYLLRPYERLGRAGRALGRLDDALGPLPLARAAGDHFLMVLTRRG